MIGHTQNQSAAVATLFQQAFDLFRAGELDAAETTLRQVIAASPEHGNALAMMGEIEASRGRMSSAIAWHEQAIRTEPKAARFRCYIGSALAAIGRFREALMQYERALKIHPQFTMALTGIARVNLLRGKADRAHAALTPHVDSERADDRMRAVYAKVLRKLQPAEETLAYIAAHIDAMTDGTSLRDMHLLRAELYEKQDDYSAAFTAFTDANRALSRPYDHAGTIERCDRIIEQFSAEALAHAPRATNTSELPVFIVGMPRSGSTLIEQIIHAHPQAHGAGELSDLNDVLRDFYEAQEHSHAHTEDDMSASALDAVADAYLTRLRTYSRKADRIVDKLLGNFEHLGVITLLFPNAKIIHARREAVSNCFSCFVHPLSPFLQPWAGDLTDVGSYYNEYARLMQHWRDIGISMLEVDYESVVADIDDQARRIVDHLGLPWDDRCLAFHEAKRNVTTMSYDQVNKPIYTTALSRTDRYGSFLDPLREALSASTSNS